MTQAHASLVALGTAAAYFRNPQGYDPEAAWRATLAELDPSGGLAILAEQTRSSPLDLDDALALGAAVDGVTDAYPTATWQDSMEALIGEIIRQLGAPATIAAHLGGTPLGEEIVPWVAELGAHMQVAVSAVQFLRAMKPDFLQTTATVTGGEIHVSGRAVSPDEAIVATLAATFATVPALSSFADLFTCKGNVLSADIALCPELGLNVHGKALYAVPYSLTDLRTITGKNVYRRLLELVAARYADWAGRQGPGSNALAATLDGAPLTLAADGSFDVTVPLPASGSVMLLVTTAGGDATSRIIP